VRWRPPSSRGGAAIAPLKRRVSALEQEMSPPQRIFQVCWVEACEFHTAAVARAKAAGARETDVIEMIQLCSFGEERCPHYGQPHRHEYDDARKLVVILAGDGSRRRLAIMDVSREGAACQDRS
jgi:hypothetical protein